jgi:hypothetical protein
MRKVLFCAHIFRDDDSNAALHHTKYKSRTRTRTNTIPNGTKANAAGLSGCACVTRMRSGEKGEVLGQARKCKALE